ncbi:hypothetical protein BKA80DRAFT_278109 [Phyllosticta citrichinensis]
MSRAVFAQIVNQEAAQNTVTRLPSHSLVGKLLAFRHGTQPNFVQVPDRIPSNLLRSHGICLPST